MFSSLILTGCVITWSWTSGITIDDYCMDTYNTPCFYKCQRASRCGITDDSFQLLTDDEREFITKKHNDLREEAASGKHEKLDAGADMEALSYDQELEFLISCYIKQCIYEHDKVRKTSKGEDVGQNLFSSFASKPEMMDYGLLDKAVQTWFDEYKLVTPSYKTTMYTNFHKDYVTRHLTQVIWAKTKYVGCAKMHSIRRKGWHAYDVYCNYKPLGNIKGSIVYTPGAPSCTEKVDEYKYLCGRVRPLSEDKYEPPINLNGERKVKPKNVIVFSAFLVTVYLCIS